MMTVSLLCSGVYERLEYEFAALLCESIVAELFVSIGGCG